jgi:hypothetical protein
MTFFIVNLAGPTQSLTSTVVHHLLHLQRKVAEYDYLLLISRLAPKAAVRKASTHAVIIITSQQLGIDCGN